MTWLDQFSQAVRAYVVVVLVTTFCGVFVWGAFVSAGAPIIGSDAFCGVLGAAVTWWFKSRDEKATRDDAHRAGP